MERFFSNSAPSRETAMERAKKVRADAIGCRPFTVSHAERCIASRGVSRRTTNTSANGGEGRLS
jgi:hypothetical protein